MIMTTTGVIPAAAYIGVRLWALTAPWFCRLEGSSSVGAGDDVSSAGCVGVADAVGD